MQLSPYHVAHGCTTLGGAACPANMCKGKILDGLLSSSQYAMAAYVGDGRGDYCSCTRLGPRDLIFARTTYPPKPVHPPAPESDAPKAPRPCPLLAALKSNGGQIVDGDKEGFLKAAAGAVGRQDEPGWNARGCRDRIESAVVPWAGPDDLASLLLILASCWSSQSS
ncbi:unnamed protein product [Ostreobium quekettii]|uniref:Uncharacterized protein n=1 Tax=Ostreobium quekettii TaxID=121088 RepID=A0A8S1J5J9_9CHLO|nr:unnamed protein product [Ostreobium quekettii]